MTVSSLWSLSLLLLGPTLPLWATGISCINEDGKPVDWYILYKFPKHMSSGAPGSGLEYMFMNALTPTWKRSEYFINMTESALGQTLQQLYQMYRFKKNSTAYVIYNDGPPNNMNYSWTRGHSKDKQLLCYNPNIYNCSIPKAFELELFNLQMMCTGSEPPPVPWKQRLMQLQSAQGEIVFNFAKAHSSHEDIYVAWMAQKLQTDFLIESWHHKGHGLFSNCSLPYHVYNIKQIKIPWNASFSSYFDHSKWCVSLKPKDQWACIGDLNYAAYQAKRSGGFVCTQNQFIYKAFRSLVLQYYDCDPSCVYT